jgi:hypothetical protein
MQPQIRSIIVCMGLLVLTLSLTAGADEKGGTGKNSDNTLLDQNRPNPFREFTIIPFTVAKQGRVVLSVYDLSGKQVITLVDQVVTKGGHRLYCIGGLRADTLQAENS